MMLRGSSGLPKISRDGFETIEIFKDCAGFIGVSTGSATSAVLAAGVSPTSGAGSSNTVGLGVGNVSSIEGVEIAFEFSEDN